MTIQGYTDDKLYHWDLNPILFDSVNSNASDLAYAKESTAKKAFTGEEFQLQLKQPMD